MVQRQLIRRLITALYLAVVPGTTVFAMEIVVESEATIENEDITLARQLALRRAMAHAVEQAGGWLQSTTVTTAVGVQERTSLTGNNQVLGTRIMSEQIADEKLRLTVEVRLAGPGQPGACHDHPLPLRKVLVTAFPLHAPEQIALGEYTGWPEVTADHLARLFNRGKRLLASTLATQNPFTSPADAPDLWRKDGTPVLRDWARSARAQYVLTGVFRDFGTTRKYFVIPERQLVIEAFIYDGISGELLARQDFTRELSGRVRLPRTTVFESKAFSESTLGQTYLSLTHELARWAEHRISCLPFAARVIQVNGTRLHLDVGSDSGLEPGMEFLLTREDKEKVVTPEGDTLGRDIKPLAGAVIRSVHPRYSVAELTAKKNPPSGRVGDVLYGQ